MAFKQFALDEQTNITVYKHRQSRSLRLSIGANGAVRVSIPTWAPYQAGVAFARSRQAWIAAQQKPETLIAQGQAIGKAHHIYFESRANASNISSRVGDTHVIITHPANLTPHSPAVQKVATQAALRALRKQAERLLPQRLETLAKQHQFSYRSVGFKKLKSRWGSCDQHGNIVLNVFLMQLPWDCIDYVLLHELNHTRHHHHGPDFWQAMKALLPTTAQLRRQLRSHQPVLLTTER